MNKTLLSGGAVLAIAAVIGYTALGNANRSAGEGATAAPAGIQMADASTTSTDAASEEATESASTEAMTEEADEDEAEMAAPDENEADEESAEVEETVVEELVLLEDSDPAVPFVGTTTESGGYTGDVVEGDPDAKVTIIEYASLTCPHCASFHKTIYKPFKKDYIDTGKVRFIYRDFPLDNFALAASVIARCGGEKKYNSYIDLFMAKQDQWRSSENIIDELKKLARLGGLGSDKIDQCVKDKDLGQSIIDRARLGQDHFGVRSTPTILINGEKLEQVNLAGLTDAVDAALEE